MTAPQLASLPLAALALSPRNVAQVGRDDVADLVASIRAVGLLQNLVAIAPDDPQAPHLVAAGGRRLRALQQLHADGEWPPDVDVLAFPAGTDLTEASMAENVIRVAMHPADEFTAYQRLQREQRLSPGAIAARFGKTTRYVEQRLLLANVAPSILQALREGTIELDQVIALSITNDHPAQERVWKAASKGGAWDRQPDNLRKALTKRELSVRDDAVAAFVGVEAYEAAGGKARVDIFGSAADAWLPDASLVRQLAQQKLQALADALREAEGWAWAEGRLEFTYSDRDKFRIYGDRWDTRATGWPKDAYAVAGCIVTISHQGKADIQRGFVRPEDVRKGKAAAGKGGHAAPKKAAAGGISFAQVQRLQGHRTAAVQLQLASNPATAIAALTAELASAWLGTDFDRMVEIVPNSRTRSGNATDAMRANLAAADMAARGERLAAELEPHAKYLFKYLVENPATAFDALGYLIACRVDTSQAYDRKEDPGAGFAAIAGVDMRTHWSVNEDWLRAQPRQVLQAAVLEACGKAAAATFAAVKGKELAVMRACELLLAAGWLPPTLRLGGGPATTTLPPPKPKPTRKPRKAARTKGDPA